MLGTLLEKLEPLLSKAFLISSFFPFLIFSFCNGMMLYLLSPGFREQIEHYWKLESLQQGFVGFSVLIAIAVLAYAFSTLNLLMREMLEGKHFPKAIKHRLIELQQARLNVLEDKIDQAKRTRRAIRRGQAIDQWVAKLQKAREKGNKTEQCSYDGKGSGIADAIEILRNMRRQGQVIGSEKLADVVNMLAAELENHSAEVANDASLQLDQHHVELYQLIDYGEKKASAEFATLYSERQFNFPPERVEPTAMGNIAESAWGHAQYRYGLNLSVFWASLQKVAQKDEKFQANLLDSKASLDFMVSMYWLTLVFAVLWLPVLLIYGTSVWAFLALGILGPVVTAICYALGLQNYRAFAQMVRTTADLFRLDLIKTLGFPRPSTMLEERQLWDDLTGHLAYDADKNLPYRSRED